MFVRCLNHLSLVWVVHFLFKADGQLPKTFDYPNSVKFLVDAVLTVGIKTPKLIITLRKAIATTFHFNKKFNSLG
jgi:hypothetical protein